MNGIELLKIVDHTLLKAFATWEDIKVLCDEAIEYNTASVCVPPCYIKTSTGFGTGGATMDDVKLFKQHIGPNVKIKAAGGIKSIDDMTAFVNAGCSRLGTSSAIKLINDAKR